MSGDVGVGQVVVGGDVGVGQVVVAGLVRRGLTRAADALLMLALGLAGALVATVVVGVLAIPFFEGFLLDQGAGAAAGLAVLWLVLMALALVPVYRYEAVPTARRGQTFGKQAFSIAVVSFPYRGEQGLSRRRSRIRWAVPYGAFLAAGAAGMASSAVLGVWGLVAGAGAAAAGWTAVYASVLLDGDRRGWHDKAAGTAVVRAGDDGTPLLAQPGDGGSGGGSGAGSAARSPRGVSYAVRVALVALVVAAAAAAVSSGAYPLVDSLRVDKYDDAIRGVRPGTQRVNFGQFFSPDGDGCWSEDARVYCDLVSIGGLHWDTGDLGDVEQPTGYLGSGVLCAMSQHGARCWEWSPDVQPRPARVPDGAVFRRIVGAGGFVCGQTPDYQQVICWTVGVDQRNYRQATHRFTDDTEWGVDHVGEDPPSFIAYERRGTHRVEHYHAFTGVRLGGPPDERKQLQTETTP